MSQTKKKLRSLESIWGRERERERWDLTVGEKSACSKTGLQEKIVTEDWNSEIPSWVNLARKKWVKREKAERTIPTKPTHFILDFNTISPFPFIAPLDFSHYRAELKEGEEEEGVAVEEWVEIRKLLSESSEPRQREKAEGPVGWETKMARARQIKQSFFFHFFG